MRNFDGLVFKCIDETLAGVMGFVARDSIYLDLLTSFSVSREDLPHHLDSLMAIFESRLGSGPARVLSRAIARRLYSELQMEFPSKPEADLPTYVNEAKDVMLIKFARTEQNETSQTDSHADVTKSV